MQNFNTYTVSSFLINIYIPNTFSSDVDLHSKFTGITPNCISLPSLFMTGVATEDLNWQGFPCVDMTW